MICHPIKDTVSKSRELLQQTLTDKHKSTVGLRVEVIRIMCVSFDWHHVVGVVNGLDDDVGRLDGFGLRISDDTLQSYKYRLGNNQTIIRDSSRSFNR